MTGSPSAGIVFPPCIFIGINYYKSRIVFGEELHPEKNIKKQIAD
jgi:hypothetical protein